jgi:hypothetical protein
MTKKRATSFSNLKTQKKSLSDVAKEAEKEVTGRAPSKDEIKEEVKTEAKSEPKEKEQKTPRDTSENLLEFLLRRDEQEQSMNISLGVSVHNKLSMLKKITNNKADKKQLATAIINHWWEENKSELKRLKKQYEKKNDGLFD